MLRLLLSGALIVCLGGFAAGATGDSLSLTPGTEEPVQGLEITQVDPSVLPYIPRGHNLPPPSDATIYRDLDHLPEAARDLRDELLAAARTGQVDAFVPIFEQQTAQPQLSFGEVEDPIEFLKQTSNDGEARETMAILEELLEAPFAAFNEGMDDEFYVWPYFVATNLEDLSPAQLVDCYKIVSHQDLEEMRSFGGWFFYRVAISAKGEWLAFVAGD
jgi:hypothetical protein